VCYPHYFQPDEVDSSDLAGIWYLSSSSREVLCRQSWWQMWSFWRFKCSRTIMLKEWPECSDDLFGVRNVSHGCHPLVVSATFLLGSTQVLAAQPHLPKVVHVGHSVQFLSLCLYLDFQVVFCISRIEYWVIACQHPVIGLCKLPHNDFFKKGLRCGFWLAPANHIPPTGKPGIHSNTMWYDWKYVTCHTGEIHILGVRFLFLAPPVGDVRYPKCTVICIGLEW